jgi:hypothetical protein
MLLLFLLLILFIFILFLLIGKSLLVALLLTPQLPLDCLRCFFSPLNTPHILLLPLLSFSGQQLLLLLVILLSIIVQHSYSFKACYKLFKIEIFTIIRSLLEDKHQFIFINDLSSNTVYAGCS